MIWKVDNIVIKLNEIEKENILLLPTAGHYWMER